MFIVNKKLWLKLLCLTAENKQSIILLLAINFTKWKTIVKSSNCYWVHTSFILIHIHNDSDKLKTEN